jgi:vacuolar-type H+-ATPase subunit E/Vma4
METKDYFIVGLGILGWIWAIIQFILNRKYQKLDKAIDKRFEVYSNFMTQMDEMSLSMRNDPKMTYGISNDFMAEILTGDEAQINNALLKFNQNLLETTKSSLQPMMIVNQELNKLKLVASEKLLPKINEYKILVNDFTNEFQTVLNKLSTSNDLEYTAQQLQSIGHEERGKRMTELWQNIERLMRDEIDYYKK